MEHKQPTVLDGDDDSSHDGALPSNDGVGQSGDDSTSSQDHAQVIAQEIQDDIQGTGWPDNALNDELRRELLMPHPTGAAAARKPPSVPLAPMKRMQARFNPLADFLSYVVVFVGGCFGTAFRYGLWLLIPANAGNSGLLMAFHPATFVANMVACFLFAVLTSYMAQAIWVKKRVRQLAGRGLGMGMCGGFSTLSAMMIEDITAMNNHGYVGLLLYTIISFICGIAVAWFGSWLGIRITARRVASDTVAQALREQVKAKPAIGVRVPNPNQNPDEMTSSSLGAMARREADPDTDEIPVVADPMTGEVK